MSLTAVHRKILAGNLLLQKDLEELATRLGAVQILLLKGAAFLAAGCADSASRPMEDIDILIRPEDRRSVISALEAMGYEKYPLDPGQYRKGRLAFDIHDEIWYLSGPELDEVWGRASEAPGIGRRNVRMPHPEDLLIHTLAHAAVHHGEVDPKWIDDAVSIRQNFAGRIDEIRVRAEIRRLGLAAPVEQFLRGQKPALRGHFARFWHLRGWLFRARYAMRTLFPSADFVKRRYDLKTRRQVWGWRIWRPVQLLAAGLRKAHE